MRVNRDCEDKRVKGVPGYPPVLCRLLRLWLGYTQSTPGYNTENGSIGTRLKKMETVKLECVGCGKEIEVLKEAADMMLALAKKPEVLCPICFQVRMDGAKNRAETLQAS